VAGPFTRHSRPSDLSALSATQLSALWRKSAVSLLIAARSADAVLEAVRARAVLLAELERRDPVTMAAWIAAGALEADGPPAYLLGVRSMSSRER